MIDSKLVLDTSIIIDGKASQLIESGEIGESSAIIVPVAALDELQAQASRHREEGFVGLRELTKIRALSGERNISIVFSGDRPSLDDIRLARNGRIDAMIRDAARANNATLLTADYVQALVGEAQGVKVKHFAAEVKTKGLSFEEYFDNETLSVHLKEDVKPYAKKGKPGNFLYTSIGDRVLSRDEMEQLAKEITEASRISAGSSIEISRNGATIIQHGKYRIAIARPPFSDALEMTIVKPLVRMRLEDYDLAPQLESRLANRAEGILIAGPPGSGKSTLASSLADFYLEQGKVVKTFESPRDLQVSKGVTQYGPLEGDFEKSAEILLLVRPDYTIFDEVRRTRDFEIFSDMRLAGVGMVGVVHASDPINAVQRFMGRIELGMIPHVVDTVIFVRAGKIERVLELKLVVKVPSGMNEPDLARPVVEVTDFETGNLAFEIYTFGEENVIIPIEAGEGKRENTAEKKRTGVEKLAEERVLELVRKFDQNAEVRVLSPTKVEIKVSEEKIPRIIGKGGSQVRELEEMLGLHIDVEPRTGAVKTDSQIPAEAELSFDYKQKGNAIEFSFSPEDSGKMVGVYSDRGDMIFQATISRKGKIRVPKKSENGSRIIMAIKSGEEPRVVEL